MLPRLRTLIVDDDEGSAKKIKNLMESDADLSRILEIVEPAPSLDEALVRIAIGKYNVLIIDYNLGGNSDCFDLINKVSPDKLEYVVLTSVRDDDAYKRKVGKLKLKWPHIWLPPANVKDSAQHLFSELQDRMGKSYKLSDKLELTDSQIIFIEASGNYAKYYYRLNSSDELTSLIRSIPMNKCSKEMNQFSFVICHRRYMVNTSYVTTYFKHPKNKSGYLFLDAKFNTHKVALAFSEGGKDNLKARNIIHDGNKLKKIPSDIVIFD